MSHPRAHTRGDNLFNGEDKETGIIIMTEYVADMIRPTVNRYLFTESFPLIVEIPDRKGMKADRPGIREMVNAAIGLKL